MSLSGPIPKRPSPRRQPFPSHAPLPRCDFLGSAKRETFFRNLATSHAPCAPCASYAHALLSSPIRTHSYRHRNSILLLCVYANEWLAKEESKARRRETEERQKGRCRRRRNRDSLALSLSVSLSPLLLPLFIFPASCRELLFSLSLRAALLCSAAFLRFDAATKSMQHFFSHVAFCIFNARLDGDRQNGGVSFFRSTPAPILCHPPPLTPTPFFVRRPCG